MTSAADPQAIVAIAQVEPVLGDLPANLETVDRVARAAAARGADLVVLPECTLQGYVFDSLAWAHEIAIATDDDPALERLEAVVAETGVALVVGFVERVGDGVANSVIAVLPDGSRVVYRKTHLPALGVDRWAVPGEALATPFELRGVRFGILVCYDLRYPEAARSLALAGADALLLPTNWPEGYEATADHVARTRAWENRIWLLAANRVGTEEDTTFIGRSLVVDPLGSVVASAPAGDEETLLLTEVTAAPARSKLLPGHAGETFDFMRSRRPALYGELARDGR